MNESIPDDKLMKLLNVLYNRWFAKWRHRARAFTDADRRQAIEELNQIYEQGKQYPIVEELCIAFYMELDARSRGGRYALVPREVGVEHEGFIIDRPQVL